MGTVFACLRMVFSRASLPSRMIFLRMNSKSAFFPASHTSFCVASSIMLYTMEAFAISVMSPSICLSFWSRFSSSRNSPCISPGVFAFRRDIS